LEYARDQLWLSRGLEPHLKAELAAADAWQAWTLVDAVVPEERLQRLSQGGAIETSDIEADIRSEVPTSMAAHAPASWVVPDSMACPDDPFCKRLRRTYITADDAVYYVVRTAEPDGVVEAWWQGSSAAGHMGLVTTHAIPTSELTAADLHAIAAQAVLLIWTAYDGEGLLLLERQGDF
jgi:hypothetical protein